MVPSDIPVATAHICDIEEETYWQDVLLYNCIEVYSSCHEGGITKSAPYNILLPISPLS
jgi:hypothetical protein